MTLKSKRWLRLLGLPDWQLAAILALLGFVCVLPSLGLGLEVHDDVQQRDFILRHLRGGVPPDGRPWYDVYNLESGDVVAVARVRFDGFLPWWHYPALKVQFFRPLAAAAQYFDYALFGERYGLAHLHNALWYAATCFFMSWMVLRVSRERAAALLAALLFVLDDAHASPASWLAGRNALLAATFVALSFILYDTACRSGRLTTELSLWVASLGCLVCALLSAENVVSGLPWFFAYALLLDRRPWQARMFSLGGVVVTVGMWWLLYRRFGFGSHGSGAYLDPIVDAKAFWTAFPLRYGSLFRVQFAAPWSLFGSVPVWFLLGVDWLRDWLLVPALFVFLVRRVDRDRELGFWAITALLGVVPLTAAPAHERLLTHTGIAMWMLVTLLGVALARAAGRRGPVFRGSLAILAAGLLFTHAVLAPWALARQCSPSSPDQTVQSIGSDLLDHDPAWRYRDLVVINMPSMISALGLLSERGRRKLPQPAHIAVLGATDHEVEITRLDAHTIELYSSGYLLETFSTFARGPGAPLRQGERVYTRSFDVQVMRLTPDLRPLRVRIYFHKPLEDSSLKFAYWSGQQFVPFVFPSIGMRRIIPAVFDQTHQLPEELVR